MRRGIAWRRHQTEKAIQKKENILKIWCSSSHWDGKHEYCKTKNEDPGYLNRWDFACDCSYCVYNRDNEDFVFHEEMEKQEKKHLEREYCEKYNFYL